MCVYFEFVCGCGDFFECWLVVVFVIWLVVDYCMEVGIVDCF